MGSVVVNVNWDTAKIASITKKSQKGLVHLATDIASQARRIVPKDTSKLVNSIRVEDNGGTVLVIAGGSYSGKDVPYAAAVEYGHRQQVGRFVPGYWVGNKFKYDKKAGTGMVLKKPFVKGSHYMERAKDLILSGNYLQKYFGDSL